MIPQKQHSLFRGASAASDCCSSRAEAVAAFNNSKLGVKTIKSGEWASAATSAHKGRREKTCFVPLPHSRGEGSEYRSGDAERSFGAGRQFGERRLIQYRQIGQHLAIDLNAGEM